MNEVKKKIYIKTSLLLLAVFSLLYINLFYLTKNIETSSSEIIEKKKSFEKLTTQNNQIESTRIETEELQKSMKEISEYIVDYSSISDFVTEIKDAAMDNDVELDMKVSEKEKTKIADSLSYISYNVKATGSFYEIIQFLIYLENSKYYANVEKIKISTGYVVNANNSGNIILDLILKVYVWD